MHEAVLRDFFEGLATAPDLAADVAGADSRSGGTTAVTIARMKGEFVVEPHHLVRVCEAVLSRSLSPESLQVIGFALHASDAFTWDGSTLEGERVAKTASDWSAPEINYPLTPANVEAWRTYLLTGDRGALLPRGAG